MTAAKTWEVPEMVGTHWLVHLLPSLTDFAFLLPSFILFYILQGTRLLFADCDTGWQIRTGDWILQHHSVPRTDIFSFTKPHDAWYAWEWGTDLLLAGLHKAAGLSGVAFATVLLLGFISALLFRLIRRVSGNDLLAFGFTLLAMSGSTLHWLARPHLFTWFFVLVFSHAILSAERGNRRPLFWLPALTMVWANLHGGFFVGIALLLVSAVGAAIEACMSNGNIKADAYRLAKPYLLCTAACCAATFANPYGWRLHQHVGTYLLDSKLLDGIQEYQSLNFRQPGAIFFEIMLLLGILSALWCLRHGKYAAGITLFLWLHLSLVSVRNLPILFLLAAPWMASLTEDALARARSLPWLKNRKSGTLSEIAREFSPFERIERWHVASAVAVMFLAYAFASSRPGFEGQFSPKNFPVAALPALRAAQPSRLFTTDQWAGYLLYAFFPAQRVFMDDRSDFYGTDFLTKYGRIVNAQYDWERVLQQFSVDAVLVDPNAAIATVLKESARWKILADGGSFILFEKKPGPPGGREVVRSSAGSVDAASRSERTGAAIDAAQHTILVPLPKLNERRSL